MDCSAAEFDDDPGTTFWEDEGVESTVYSSGVWRIL